MESASPVVLTTLLMTDVEGSTRLWEENPTAMEQAVRLYQALAEEAVRIHGGTIVKPRGEGDSLFIVFSRPSSAFAAAVLMQELWSRQDWPTSRPIRARAAIHTGEAHLLDNDYYGPMPNRCARLRECAHAGQVLATRAATELALPGLSPKLRAVSLGEHRLRDLGRSEEIFEVRPVGAEASFPAPKTLDFFPNNLPDRFTSFVGRTKDFDRISEAFNRTKLVTLIGPGGIGKTRLSSEWGARQIDRFPGGVFLVELAGTDQGQAMEPMLLTALGLRRWEGSFEDGLRSVIGKKPILFIIDNCEHRVAEVRDLIHTIRQVSESLSFLATGRTSLDVAGEQRIPISGLALPPNSREVSIILESEAGRLFCERAVLANPSFKLSPDNAEVVAEICRTASGMPLAIQIYASRCAFLSPAEVLEERRVDFGSLDSVSAEEERHRSIDAAISTSFNSLNPEEQRLLARASACRGGFDLGAAKSLCDGRSSAVKAVGSLVKSSLAETVLGLDSSTRYRILEPIREWLEGRLPGEAEEGRARLFEYLCGFVESNQGQIESGDAPSLSMLDDNRENVFFTLAHCCHEDDRTKGLELIYRLHRWWVSRGHAQLVSSDLRRLLNSGVGVAPALAGRAFNCVGVVDQSLGDLKGALRSHEAGLQSYTEANDSRGMVSSLISSGITAQDLGMSDLALKKFLEAEEISHEKVPGYLPYVQFNLAATYSELERWSEAKPLIVELLERKEALGADQLMPTLVISALCAVHDQDWSAAKKELVELTRHVTRTKDLPFSLMALDAAGRLESGLGKWESAGKCFSLASGLLKRSGIKVSPGLTTSIGLGLEACRVHLAADDWLELRKGGISAKQSSATNLLNGLYFAEENR